MYYIVVFIAGYSIFYIKYISQINVVKGVIK